MPDGAGLGPPVLHWPVPGIATDPALAALPCPNCASPAPKTLAVTVQLPDWGPLLHLLHCPGCGCRFYDNQASPDYAAPGLNDRGRVPFYVQQGAGIGTITRALARLRGAPGCTYLEVGCGYGFGLDFALRTRGWTGWGVDPAPLAAMGRDALDLPIAQRYLQDDEAAQGTVDVVAASEVIEHLPAPAGFVSNLQAMLKPGGVLLLTTPDGAAIRPDTPPGVLIPLLSPTLHLVIQTQASLHALLVRAGFAHVTVAVDGNALVAFASDAPLALEQDEAVLRATLRQHLHRRARDCDPLGDPFLGFAGRAFQESMNDGALAEADAAWALLVPACQARFGLDLDRLEALPPELAHCGLERQAALVPLNLAGLLYASAIRGLAAGAPRAGLEARFLLAAEAAAALLRGLDGLAMADGQTEDIGWTAEAEAVLCAAAAGSPSVPSRLLALPHAPASGGERHLAIVQRALTTLVNAGHLTVAASLAQATRLHHESFADPVPAPRTDAARDALYALAVLAVNWPASRDSLGGLGLARARFRRVLDHAAPDSGLFQAALQGEQAARPAATGSMLKRALRPAYRALRHALPHLAELGTSWRSPRQAVWRWPEDRVTLGPKVCIFAHWDGNGAASPGVLHYLRSLVECGFSVVFASNAGRLHPATIAALRPLCAGILVRRNLGYDFGAWREALDWLGLPRVDTQMLVLANDSLHGPVRRLHGLLTRFDLDAADAWGCTDSYQHEYHLQSYMLAFSPAVLASPAWRGFWAGVRPTGSKHRMIQKYELGLTRALQQAGFTCRAAYRYWDLVQDLPQPTSAAGQQQAGRLRRFLDGGVPVNPSCDLWRALLAAGFPFMKRDLLEGNAAGVPDAAEWQDVAAHYAKEDGT